MQLLADFLMLWGARESSRIRKASYAYHIVVGTLAALLAPRVVRIDPRQPEGRKETHTNTNQHVADRVTVCNA